MRTHAYGSGTMPMIAPDSWIAVSAMGLGDGISFKFSNGDVVELDEGEILALKQLLPKMVDMDLFRTLTEAVGIDGAAALAASMRSDNDT